MEPSQSSKRLRFTRQSQTDGLTCSICKEGILYDGEHVQLTPCSCSLCYRCLVDAHARRGSSPLTCGTCDLQVEAHQPSCKRCLPTGDDVVYNTGADTTANEDKIMKKEPFRYLLRDKFETLKSAAAGGRSYNFRLVFCIINEDGRQCW